MTERTVTTNGVELWTEDFGDRANPTVLLLMGAGVQGIVWEDELCRTLADGGRHVIRYDHRDVGQSTTTEFQGRPYTLRDLAADVIGILDAYDVDSVHLVGASMGGGVAQHVALEHPERVSSMTLLFTSPALKELIAGTMGQGTGFDLPSPQSPAVLEVVTAMLTNPPLTREDRIGFDVRMFRAMAGPKYPLDEPRWQDLLARAYDRAIDWTRSTNHQMAMLSSEPDLRPRLAALDVPTTVVHGTDDPAVPFVHGEALAAAIPGAKFVPIDGYGHQFHRDVYPLWREVVLSQDGV